MFSSCQKNPNFSYYLCDNGYKPWLQSHLITGSSSIKGGGGEITSPDIFFLIISEVNMGDDWHTQ